MNTAVSIPDERREPGEVTRALDNVADELAAEPGAFAAHAARRILECGQW